MRGLHSARRAVFRPAFVSVVAAAFAIVCSGCSWIIRADVSSSGTQGNGYVDSFAISGDAHFVVFTSDASNLVAGDTNGRRDVFVRDNRTHEIARVNVDASGAQANGNSGDLHSVAISDDGRYVAFNSRATNLLPNDPPYQDVFVRDRKTGSLERIPKQQNAESSLLAMSGNGRYVVLINSSYVVYDRQTATTAAVPSGSDFTVSDDGHIVAYGDQELVRPPDTWIWAAQLYDWQTQSATTIFNASNIAMSGDTRFVAYALHTCASLSCPTRAYVGGELVSLSSSGATLDGFPRDVSDDGRYVLFETSEAGVPNDTNGTADLYVRDRATETTFLADRSALGTIANDGTDNAVLSDDGRFVAFVSFSTNLVSGDTNNAPDVFVRSIPEPVANSVSPGSAARGTSATLTVIGQELLPSSHVVATGGGVTVDAVTWVSDEELTVSITVTPDAATGARSIVVKLPGTGPGPGAGAAGICANCLTIT